MDFKQEDRDLLIKHDVKLALVCDAIGKLDKKMDKLGDKIDDNIKIYITRKMFLSINGIIIGLLIILFGYTANLDKQVTKNTVCIEKIEQTSSVN